MGFIKTVFKSKLGEFRQEIEVVIAKDVTGNKI